MGVGAEREEGLCVGGGGGGVKVDACNVGSYDLNLLTWKDIFHMATRSQRAQGCACVCAYAHVLPCACRSRQCKPDVCGMFELKSNQRTNYLFIIFRGKVPESTI